MTAAGRGETMRIVSAVVVVMALGASLVLVGDLHPDSKAVEMLSSHHRVRQGEHAAHRRQTTGLIQSDADRMQELSRLVDAADEQAKKASQLRSQEASKLEVAPDSKVDAEEMLAHEAQQKGVALDQQLTSIRGDIKGMTKHLRRANHLSREEGRLLHKVDGEKRDSMISLHDKEMKVLEARHDVQNAAKEGDVGALRDAQQRLANRKDIAKGARAEYDQLEKEQDQVKAKARLLEKRAKMLEESINRKKATIHNDELKMREEYATSLAIGSRANFLRDKTALVAARKKYSALAELLSDPSTDHQQVEDTLSKIASNIHSWEKLEKSDRNEMEAKARLYKKAKENVATKSISLSDKDQTVGQSLYETFSSADPQQFSMLQQQFVYAAPPQQQAGYAYAASQQLPQYPAPMQQQQQQQQATQYAPPQYAAAAPMQAAPMQPTAAPAVEARASMPTGALAAAPASLPAVLPGAVGNVPYVYNDKQYLPSAAPTTGYPIVWLFADNKTEDPLYFGYQSADGVMHVYNEIKPHAVTRQQAFANEYWTILAADKRTVAVQPFKITQDNQWLSIGPASQQTLAAK